MIIGLTVKAFLHIRIFEVSTGAAPGKSVPVGIETVTQLFEPWLLRNIGLEHWIAKTEFLTAAVAKHSNLNQTRATALGAIPSSFDAVEKAAMIADLNAAATVNDVLDVYLTNVGCRGFRTTFPRN